MRLAIFLALVAWPAAAQGPAPLQRTMSDSGQFAVYGETAARRLAVARRAEELRSAWREAAGDTGQWKWPVVIDLAGPPTRRGPTPSTALFLGDGDLLKVQVSAPAGASDASLDVAILDALGLEFVYRAARPKEGKPYSAAPEWLGEAVYQQVLAGENGLSPALFAKLVESGPPPKLEAFLRQRPDLLNPTSRAIYRAHAYGLLAALSGTTEGKEGIRRLLASLHAAQPDDPAPLFAAFPSLKKEPAQLVKLWTLALARVSASDRVEALSGVETDRRLTEILAAVRVPAGVKLQPGEPSEGAAAMPVLARHASGRFVVARAAEDLLRLETRAHLLFRPVVEEFRTVAVQLSTRPRRDAAKRLAAAAELQSALRVRTEAIADHLNWFEAARLDTPSHAFEGALPEPATPKPTPRADPISVAVEAAERAQP